MLCRLQRRLAYSVTVPILSLKYWSYKAEELNLYALSDESSLT